MSEQIGKNPYINNQPELFKNTRNISEYLRNKPRTKTCFWRRNQKNFAMGPRVTFLEVETAVSSFLSMMQYLRTQKNISDEEKSKWLGGNNVKEGILLNLDQIIRNCDGYINARKTLFFKERRDRRELIKELRDVLRVDRNTIDQTQDDDVLTTTDELLLNKTREQLRKEEEEAQRAEDETKYLSNIDEFFNGDRRQQNMMLNNRQMSLEYLLKYGKITIDENLQIHSDRPIYIDFWLAFDNRYFKLESLLRGNHIRLYDLRPQGRNGLTWLQLLRWGFVSLEWFLESNTIKIEDLKAANPKHGFTLFEALFGGGTRRLKYLLEKDLIKIEEFKDYGFTVLESLHNGYLPIEIFLEEGRINVHKFKEYGVTLGDAVKGNLVKLESLLNDGTITIHEFIDKEKPLGITLLEAIRGKFLDLKLLLNQGTITIDEFIDKEKHLGFSLWDALQAKYVDLRDLLLQGYIKVEDIADKEKYGFSLWDALQAKHIYLNDLLLEGNVLLKLEGLKTNQKYGFTFFEALQAKHIYLCMLLSRGHIKLTDLENKEKYGFNLWDAIVNLYLSMDYILSEKHLNVEDLKTSQKYGFTLWDALKNQYIRLSWLLEKKHITVADFEQYGFTMGDATEGKLIYLTHLISRGYIDIKDLKTKEKYGFSLWDAVQDEHVYLGTVLECGNANLVDFKTREQYGFSLYDAIKAKRISLRWMLSYGLIQITDFEQYGFSLYSVVQDKDVSPQWLLESDRISLQDFEQYGLNVLEEIQNGHLTLEGLLENEKVHLRDFEGYGFTLVDAVQNRWIDLGRLLAKRIISIADFANYRLNFLDEVNRGNIPPIKELLQNDIITIKEIVLYCDGGLKQLLLDRELDLTELLKSAQVGNLVTMSDLEGDGEYEICLRDALADKLITLTWLFKEEFIALDDLGNSDRYGFNLREAIEAKWITTETLEEITQAPDQIEYILRTLDSNYVYPVDADRAFFDHFKNKYAYSLAKEGLPELSEQMSRRLDEYRVQVLTNATTLQQKYVNAAGRPRNPDVKEVRAILNYHLKQKMKMGFTDKFYQRVELAWRRVNVEYPNWGPGEGQTKLIIANIQKELTAIFQKDLIPPDPEPGSLEGLISYYTTAYGGGTQPRVQELSLDSYKVFQRVLKFLKEIKDQAPTYNKAELANADELLKLVRTVLEDTGGACVGRLAEVINSAAGQIDLFKTRDVEQGVPIGALASQSIRDQLLGRIKGKAAENTNEVHMMAKFPNTFRETMNFSQVNTIREGGFLDFDWYWGILREAINLLSDGFKDEWNNIIAKFAGDTIVKREVEVLSGLNISAFEYIKFRENSKSKENRVSDDAVNADLEKCKNEVEAIKDEEDASKLKYPNLMSWLKGETVNFKDVYQDIFEGCYISVDLGSGDEAMFLKVFGEFAATGSTWAAIVVQVLLRKEGYVYDV